MALIVLFSIHVLAFIIGSALWGVAEYREDKLTRVEWHSRKRGNIERINNIGQFVLMVTYLSSLVCAICLGIFAVYLRINNAP